MNQQKQCRAIIEQLHTHIAQINRYFPKSSSIVEADEKITVSINKPDEQPFQRVISLTDAMGLDATFGTVKFLTPVGVSDAKDGNSQEVA